MLLPTCRPAMSTQQGSLLGRSSPKTDSGWLETSFEFSGYQFAVDFILSLSQVLFRVQRTTEEIRPRFQTAYRILCLGAFLLLPEPGTSRQASNICLIYFVHRFHSVVFLANGRLQLEKMSQFIRPQPPRKLHPPPPAWSLQ